MRISFTGTREGMTQRQKEAFEILVLYFCNPPLSFTVLTHGGAEGADTDAHNIARKITRAYIQIRPCNQERQRFWIEHNEGYGIFHPKLPLERNRDIVDDGQILIATPQTLKEELRSGTWATIRYARKRGKPVIVLDP